MTKPDVEALDRLKKYGPPIVPDGVTDCTAGIQFKVDVASIAAALRERDELKAECEWLRAFARAVSVADGWDYDDWRLAALTPSEKEKQT